MASTTGLETIRTGRRQSDQCRTPSADLFAQNSYHPLYSGENNKLTTLTTRANTAERPPSYSVTQASQAEDRLAEAKVKYGEGEGKWAARIKELELRCKACRRESQEGGDKGPRREWQSWKRSGGSWRRIWRLLRSEIGWLGFAGQMCADQLVALFS